LGKRIINEGSHARVGIKECEAQLLLQMVAWNLRRWYLFYVFLTPCHPWKLGVIVDVMPPLPLPLFGESIRSPTLCFKLFTRPKTFDIVSFPGSNCFWFFRKINKRIFTL
jgi:hypothetical protein